MWNRLAVVAFAFFAGVFVTVLLSPQRERIQRPSEQNTPVTLRENVDRPPAVPPTENASPTPLPTEAPREAPTEAPATPQEKTPETSTQESGKCPVLSTIKLSKKARKSSGALERAYLWEALTLRPQSTIFVIGANVGDTFNDDSWAILKHMPTVRKIFVEPIPSLFRQLRKNGEASKMQNAAYVNRAVGKKSGEKLTMWCYKLDRTTGVPVSPLPGIFAQLCSMSKGRLFNSSDTQASLKHLPQVRNNFDDYVEAVEIETITVADLFKTHVKSLNDISYVQVDAEGFDHMVMMQMPLKEQAFRPCSIVWEHQLLRDEQNTDIIDSFTSIGFELKRGMQSHTLIRATP